MRTVHVALLLLGFALCLFAGTRTIDSAPAALSPGQPPPAASSPSLVTPACEPSSSTLCIRHPSEGARLPALEETFVFGQALPGGKLFINGSPVPVHPGGGFLAMVKLSPGPFAINALLMTDTTAYALTRTVTVAAPPAPSPVSPLTIEYVKPDSEREVQPGEEVVVTAKGSPGMEAYFTAGRSGKKYPMIESPEPPGGIYRGMYVVRPEDIRKKGKIRVTLKDRHRGRKKSVETPEILSLFPGDVPAVGEVSAPHAVITAGPSLPGPEKAGYLLFPPRGTSLRITGRRGNEWRVRLAQGMEGWIPRNEIATMPEGAPPVLVYAGNITVAGDERSAFIRLPLGARVPFEVRPDADGRFLDVFLFGALSNTDWINYGTAGTAVAQIGWFQDAADTYRMRISAARAWWGYDASYEGTSFVLELRSPPRAVPSTSTLQGITVALDPGHSPDTGAIGPTGLVEKDVNLVLADNLRARLLAKGARVIMTRQGEEGVALYDRPRIAWQNKADLLVSLHCNALPEGQNPLEKRGYGIYYYHPASLPLARDIHAAYQASFGTAAASGFTLRDDGLYYGNLVIPRTTQMPSVLIESAYIIHPEEEAYLKDGRFIGACADAVVRGLERYLRRQCPQTAVNGEAAVQKKKTSKKALGS